MKLTKTTPLACQQHTYIPDMSSCRMESTPTQCKLNWLKPQWQIDFFFKPIQSYICHFNWKKGSKSAKCTDFGMGMDQNGVYWGRKYYFPWVVWNWVINLRFVHPLKPGESNFFNPVSRNPWKVIFPAPLLWWWMMLKPTCDGRGRPWGRSRFPPRGSSCFLKGRGRGRRTSAISISGNNQMKKAKLNYPPGHY